MIRALKEQAEYCSEAEHLRSQLWMVERWAEARRKAGGTPRRAFIIEFAGMPKSGKTLAIETVRHFLSHGPKVMVRPPSIPEGWKRNEGYLVHTPAEGVSLRTPNYLKPNLLDFNVWAGAYALQELLQARHDHYYDVVILDRGPWDAGCWLQYVKDHRPGDLDIPEEGETILQFFQLAPWTTLADLHVVLTVTPDKAARRERTARLIEHGGAASDRELMVAMQRIYTERFQTLLADKATHCPEIGAAAAILIDTTDATPKEVATQVIRQTFEVLEAKIRRWENLLPLAPEEFESVLRPYFGLLTAAENKPFAERLLRLEDATQRCTPDTRASIRATIKEWEISPPSALRNSTPHGDFAKELEALIRLAEADEE